MTDVKIMTRERERENFDIEFPSGAAVPKRMKLFWSTSQFSRNWSKIFSLVIYFETRFDRYSNRNLNIIEEMGERI